MADYLPSGSRVEVAGDYRPDSVVWNIPPANMVDSLRPQLGQWGFSIETSHGSEPFFRGLAGGVFSVDLGLVINADGQYTLDEVRGAVESEMQNVINDNPGPNGESATVTGVRVVSYQVNSLQTVKTGAPPSAAGSTTAPPDSGRKAAGDCSGFFDKWYLIGDPKCGGGVGFGTGLTSGILLVGAVGFGLLALALYIPSFRR